MEHRLITGGYEYLPFARSCITKLKKLGLPYADQSFEVGGASIKVRVEPGHEYIRIEGGGTVSLDNGVVELNNIYPAQPTTYDAGTLRETNYAVQYNAKFVLKSTDAVWRTHSGSSGQISGKLVSLKGHVPIDNRPANSFIPKKELDTSVEPPVSKYTSFGFMPEERLMHKKRLAVYCPASIFTGRCRVYVQAIYGRFRDDEFTGKLVLPELSPPYNTIGGYYPFVAPALLIKSSVEDAARVRVTTDTGIHLDDRGKHWMIVVNGTSVIVHKMKAGSAASGLSSHLVAGSSRFNAEDKSHIEAYLLGYSLPNTDSTQTLTLTVPESEKYIFGNDSLGYGWHWNYTGLVADKVVSIQVAQDNLGYPGEYNKMESTHYRLTMTKSVDEYGVVTWSAAVAVLAKSEWAGPSGGLVLANPSWDGMLEKAMPRRSHLFTCYATFYAYYNGDALVTCSMTMTEVPAKPEETTMSEGYLSAGLKGTAGFNSGFSESKAPTSKYFIATVTCAGITHSNIIFGRVDSGSGTKIYNKQRAYTDPPILIETSNNLLVGPESGTIDYYEMINGEYPNYSLSRVINPKPRPSGWYMATHWVGNNVSFDASSFNFSRPYFAYCIIVIPTCDSEAVYLRTKVMNIYYEQNIQVSHMAGGGGYLNRGALMTPGNITIWEYTSYKNNYQSATTVSSEPKAPTETHTVMFESNVAILKTGTISVNNYDVSPFTESLSDQVGDDFLTLTSASGKAIISKSAKFNPIGTTVSDTNYPAFVGWA